jgi:hypothetical protein
MRSWRVSRTGTRAARCSRRRRRGEALADMVAKKVGLKHGQSAAYTITKLALMEAVQLVGIRAGAATLNTTGFALAQIKALRA